MPDTTDTTPRRKSGFDLDSMTAQELAALIEAAEAKRTEKQEEARTALIEEFRSKAAEIGLDFKSLVPSSVGAAAPQPAGLAPCGTGGRMARPGAAAAACPAGCLPWRPPGASGTNSVSDCLAHNAVADECHWLRLSRRPLFCEVFS